MSGNIHPAPAGQVAAPSLHDLAAAIRTARADAADCFSSGIDRVREIGDRLKLAKKLAGHGRWGEFLTACGLNARTAAQYMKLAELAAQSVPGTDLSNMSIKAAIRHLSPPSSARTTVPNPPAPVSRRETSASRHTKHVDIIDVWIAAPPIERMKAIDNIGLDAVLAAIPASWLPALERRLAERRQPPAPPLALGNDLNETPAFLHREAPAKAAAA